MAQEVIPASPKPQNGEGGSLGPPKGASFQAEPEDQGKVEVLIPNTRPIMPNEEKLFYTIGEVADIVMVKPYVLRYWESEFPKLNPQKSETGQRTYRKKDIQIALTIKRLLYDEKYTIAGALKKLDEMEKEGPDSSATETAPAPLKAAASPVASTPSPAAAAPAPTRSFPPREKVKEMKELIQSTRSILKKYQLA
jgi:DNA-binding transcriptional MerR regulator